MTLQPMLHCNYYNKDTYEDSKTSAVFENLLLLPDDVFWHILKDSCPSGEEMTDNPGMLVSYDFWPHWNPVCTGNKLYVEPDLFLKFEKLHVIIEAKNGDTYGQNKEQWIKELTAYHNEYGKEGSVCLIAMGGNVSAHKEKVEIDGKPFNIYKCSWLSLRTNTDRYKRKLRNGNTPDRHTAAILRVLDNIDLAFSINGIHGMKWFDKMKSGVPVINRESIENIGKEIHLL